MQLLKWCPSAALSHAEQSREAHALLAELLRLAGIPESTLAAEPSGRPYLVGRPEVDVSLAHTEGLVASALELGDGEHPPRVGVDVERIPEDAAHAQRLAARFFAPCELREMARAASPCQCFAEIFTAKEAYAKYVGDGLSQHLRRTDTADPGFEREAGVALVRFSPPGFCVTLCRRAGSGEPVKLVP